MLKLIALLLIPMAAFANVEGEIGLYSNYIWRGTTFTENKPALQGEIDAQHDKTGLYAALFVTNAEFRDEGMPADWKVTQEVDYTVGKRWSGEDWQVQAFYSMFTFPGAENINTDEFNLMLNYKRWVLEFAYLDDYFGYSSVYRYVRAGRSWEYMEKLEGGLFLGFNQFSRPRGSHYVSGQGVDSLDGAGNPDYFDLYFVNRKSLENGFEVELALNLTNRYEYSADSAGEVSKEKAKDAAVVLAFIYPFVF